MLRKPALAFALALALSSLPVHAGVIYRSVWYPDGVVRYRNVDATTLVPGALEAVASYFRTHTPIDIREAHGEPNLFLRDLSGFGLAMTPGYNVPDWPAPGRALLFDKTYVQTADTIAHELMHALGFAHEHQRPDRDQWVDTCFNLDPFNYAIVGPAPYWVTSPYDYASIMHYQVCVTPTRPARMNPEYRGRWSLLSIHDINSLYRFYGRPLPGHADGPSVRGDFDDDGYEDVATVGYETFEGQRRVWLYFARGVATDPSEGLDAVIEVPWFRELVTVADGDARVTTDDHNGDGIPDIVLSVADQRWRIVVNLPDEEWAPWGRKGARTLVRER